jgi:tetratricopeptide (TPR) repeat protein
MVSRWRPGGLFGPAGRRLGVGVGIGVGEASRVIVRDPIALEQGRSRVPAGPGARRLPVARQPVGVRASPPDTRATMSSMPALDDLWDFDDPAASEARFHAAIKAAKAGDDPAAADEARTQLARSLGLQRRFDDGHAILDQVDAGHPALDRVRVRALLERGRLWRSSGDAAAAATPFEGAWELARSLPVPEDGLAVDAAHMLALVDAPPGEGTWHQRALHLADSSPDPGARRWRGSLWNNIGWARFEAADLEGALAAFETALAARREQGRPKETRIAEWCIARCLRALDRPAEALAIQERLAAETAAAGEPPDGYGAEEIGECLLAMDRGEEARPYLARAGALLGADAWLAEHEPDRIARLQRLGEGHSAST